MKRFRSIRFIWLGINIGFGIQFMLYVFQWLTQNQVQNANWHAQCTCTYLFVPIFARYPSIHRPIQPVSHAESTVLNVKLKGNILSHTKKKNAPLILPNGTLYIIANMVNWPLLIYGACMRRDAVCLLINSYSFLFIFLLVVNALCHTHQRIQIAVNFAG